MNREKQHAVHPSQYQRGGFPPKKTHQNKNQSSTMKKIVDAEIVQAAYEFNRLLFWTERIGFLVLTLYWVLHTILFPSWLPGKYLIVFPALWVITSYLYWIMFSFINEYNCHLRQIKDLREQQPDQELVRVTEFKEPIGNGSRFCYGFWLERLAMLYLGYGIFLYAWTRTPGAELIVNFCLMIVFPPLHIYYACFGYAREFQHDLHAQDGKRGIVKESGYIHKTGDLCDEKSIDSDDFSNINNEEEIEKKMENQDIDKDGDLSDNEAEKYPEETKRVEDERNQRSETELVSEAEKHCDDKACSPANDSGMWEGPAPEDRYVRMGEMKLMIRLLEDNYQRRMEESEPARERNLEKLIEDAWDRKHNKVVEKYEEDYQKLKEQNKDLALKLSAANASSQLYRSLLHDNVFSV